MDESLRLQLQQRQLQTLSPLQLQFVRVLEMTAPELEDEVRRSLDDNPALEIADENIPSESTDYSESAEQMQLADYRSEDDIPSYRLEASNRSADDSWREPVAVAEGESMIGQLEMQLSPYALTDDEMLTARYVIGNIDANGYLTRTPSAIANDMLVDGHIHTTGADVERIVDVVRRLDPPGIAAADLRDCLLLQLNRMPGDSATLMIARRIVTDHFESFARHHFEKIMASLGADTDTFKEAVELIRSLNPRPGNVFTSGISDDKTRQITPDFQVDVADDDGSITLTLLNSIPRLQISHSFSGEINPGHKPSQAMRDAAAFQRRKRDEAATFIRVIEMRQSALYRIMTAIIKLQRDFFLTDNPSRLRPMILKDISALTGDDISVVSRATADKYVATRSGIYPLKFFFNEKPTESSDASTHEILEAIRSVITSEDKSHPLNDSDITRALSERGYEIARRTVAKYRERLGYPVARLRRQI